MMGAGRSRARGGDAPISGAPIGTVDGSDPDYIDELEGPPEFPGCRPGVDPEGDERRRLERLDAPPMQKPAVAAEHRDRLVRGCLDGIMANWMVHGAADLLCRELAARLGTSTEEAEALVLEEQERRRQGGLPVMGESAAGRRVCRLA